jgi:hypothetical protein
MLNAAQKLRGFPKFGKIRIKYKILEIADLFFFCRVTFCRLRSFCIKAPGIFALVFYPSASWLLQTARLARSKHTVCMEAPISLSRRHFPPLECGAERVSIFARQASSNKSAFQELSRGSAQRSRR